MAYCAPDAHLSAALITTVIAAESAYLKTLRAALDAAHTSRSSLQAYVAAALPSASSAIAAAAVTLIGADDALRRYAGAVEAWVGALKGLKEVEDDVGAVMRDRDSVCVLFLLTLCLLLPWI